MSAGVAGGLVYSALTDTCGMAKVLAGLPHNRPEAADLDATLAALTRRPRTARLTRRRSATRCPQRTPAGRNWMLIRGSVTRALLGTQCSQVRWQEPPMTIRSP